MKKKQDKAHFAQRRQRYGVGLLFVLLLLSLAACNPVFEFQVAVQEQSPTRLGKVAYISGGDVWVYDLDADQAVRLTQDGTNSHPLWSADGNRLAYLKHNQLWVMNPASLQEMLVSITAVDWFDWSSSGSTLAYFLNNAGLFIWDENQQAGRSLLPIPPGNSLASFTWGQDGSMVYTRGSYKEEKYWVAIERIHLKDGTTETLSETSEMREVPQLARISADGQWIAYWLWDTQITFPEQEGLILCVLDIPHKQTQCTDSKSFSSKDFFTWSQDNRLAFFTTSSEQNRFGNSLVIAASPGFTVQQLAEFAAGQYPIHPAFSPMGEQIAYSAAPAGEQNSTESQTQSSISRCQRRIWAVSTVTRQLHQLTGDENYCDDMPQWSADGKHLLFVRTDNAHASLWMMDSNGNGLRQIVPELTPRPELFGEYGSADWPLWWEWWLPGTL